ncbi:MAG: PAS domain-containing protein [Leptospiraceae bacterium]|nr:PAS domain-containing protein [Leptospiraceae bacterium]
MRALGQKQSVDTDFISPSDLLAFISPLAALDRQGRVRYLSPTFLAEFHLSSEQSIGQSLEDVLPWPAESVEALNADVRRFLSVQTTRLDNREIEAGNRIYGYSIFALRNGVALMIKDISEIRRLEAEVDLLHSRLLRVQEEERQRIAAELHDGVGQTILAAKINLVSYKKHPDRGGFEQGVELIDQASQELREIYSNLFPNSLLEIGLPAAVNRLIRSFLEPRGCTVEQRIDLDRDIPDSLSVPLFRMCQEVFTNIVRHSSATEVEVLLEDTGDALVLQVKDNGKGFSAADLKKRSLEKGGFGLMNLKRRAEDLNGIFGFLSSPGDGTEVSVVLPWPDTEEKTVHGIIHG